MPPPNPSSFTFITKVSDWKPGMPYILECFATWCGPCRAQIPHLVSLTKKYAGQVYLVSVSDEDQATVQGMANKMPEMQNYNVAVDTNKQAENLKKKHSVGGIPHAFLFGGDGALVWQGHPAQMDSEIDKALKLATTGDFTGASRKL